MITPAPAISSSITAQHQLLAAPDNIRQYDPAGNNVTTYLIIVCVILAVACITLDGIMWLLYRKK